MAAKDSKSRLSDGARHAADLLQDLVMARRSIRRYTDQPVPETWIEKILRCGAQAPSPSNSQPVRFVRIASPDLRDTLRQALDDGHTRLLTRNREMSGGAKLRNRINTYRRYCEFMLQAPVLLGVGVLTGGTSFAGHLVAAGLMDHDPRQGMDALITVGLALKAMLLQAQALGLGSCILTAPLVFIRDAEGILDLKDLRLICLLTLGFTAESPPPVKRLPLETVCKVL